MTGTTKTWTLDDLADQFELDEAADRDGADSILAYVADLAGRGVAVLGVEREIDAESNGMVAVRLTVDGAAPLHVHVPQVPPAWLREPTRFETEWLAWEDDGNIGEVFVEGDGFTDWAKAVEAGARAAA